MEGRKQLSARALGGDRALIRERALAALKDSDLSMVLEAIGGDEEAAAAGAALKAVLAERMTEYALRAAKVARSRNMPVGAAAIIIASKE